MCEFRKITSLFLFISFCRKQLHKCMKGNIYQLNNKDDAPELGRNLGGSSPPKAAAHLAMTLHLAYLPRLISHFSTPQVSEVT